MITLLLSAPVVVKILGSLAAIIVLSRYLQRLYIPVFIGTLVLVLWSGFDLLHVKLTIESRILTLNNLFLLVTIVQIISLSRQMAETGVMKELVIIVRRHISQRAAMAVLPAIIGFLPMPGGAIFSAPLVDDCDHQQDINPVIKTRINYWFRHIWEYWWPLYPGVLLAIEISGLTTWQFMLLQFPFCLLSITCGYIFLLRRLPRPTGQGGGIRQRGDWRRLAWLLAPIAKVIILATLIKIVFPGLLQVSRFIPIAIGLCGAMGLLQFQRPLSWQQWRKVIFSQSTLNLLLVVLAIRIYGGFIGGEVSDGVTLIDTMRQELSQLGIPLVLIIMFIPFVTGFTTGVAIGFVGASFPIVFSLLGSDPAFSQLLAVNVMAFGFGYMGMILSPVHVCLIVSNEHFKTGIARSLKGLLLPAIIMLLFTICYYWAIKFIAAT